MPPGRCHEYRLLAHQALRQKGNDPRIVARQGDACALFFEDQQFDRALVLRFVSDPAKAISEMRRVVRPGASLRRLFRIRLAVCPASGCSGTPFAQLNLRRLYEGR
jgi:ubiquinone/menaquinone biosynthesis C-methylase UbiE